MQDRSEDLHDALRTFAQRLARVLDARIAVTLDLSELPTCEVPCGAVEEVLVPLVRHARDALLPEGGEMAIRALREEADTRSPAVRLVAAALTQERRERYSAVLPVRRCLPVVHSAPATGWEAQADLEDRHHGRHRHLR